jgi:hypothetical protein
MPFLEAERRALDVIDIYAFDEFGSSTLLPFPAGEKLNRRSPVLCGTDTIGERPVVCAVNL